MPQPSQYDVHVDRPLTNVSVAYIQNSSNFICTSVFPVVPVEKQTDKFFTYTKGDWFRDEAKLRADSTESAGSGYGLSTDSYSCEVYAMHKDVGDQVRANADNPINLDTEAVQFVTQRLMLRQEIQFATDAFGTGIWGTTVTGGTNFTAWSNQTSSDPITDIETGKATILTNTGYMPNTLVLGYNTFKNLKHHPDVIARISGGATNGAPALASTQLMAQLFGVDRVLVAMAIKNTGLEAETVSMSFVEGDHALLCYVNPNPGLLAPSAGYTFVWRGVSEGLGTNIGITRFRMPELRADRIEGQIAFDNKIVATDLGYFFASAV